jgi:hypothetical protein
VTYGAPGGQRIMRQQHGWGFDALYAVSMVAATLLADQPSGVTAVEPIQAVAQKSHHRKPRAAVGAQRIHALYRIAYTFHMFDVTIARLS